MNYWKILSWAAGLIVVAMLYIFTQEEGGAEHIGLDNLPYVGEFTADWIAETFAELG